jgi:hypothetical protein
MSKVILLGPEVGYHFIQVITLGRDRVVFITLDRFYCIEIITYAKGVASYNYWTCWVFQVYVLNTIHVKLTHILVQRLYLKVFWLRENMALSHPWQTFIVKKDYNPFLGFQSNVVCV